MPTSFFQKALACRHIAATNEDGRALQILRPARENRAVHQVAKLLRPDSSIAEDFIRPGVNCHHSVKNAGLRIGIQLNEDLFLVHYFSKIGCLTVSFLARISSIFGSPFIARWMASLVAS